MQRSIKSLIPLLLCASSAYGEVCDVTGYWYDRWAGPGKYHYFLQQSGADPVTGIAKLTGWHYAQKSLCPKSDIVGEVHPYHGNPHVIFTIYSIGGKNCDYKTSTKYYASIMTVNCDLISGYDEGNHSFDWDKYPSHLNLYKPEKDTEFLITKELTIPTIQAAVERIQDELPKALNSPWYYWDIEISHPVRPSRTIRSHIPKFSSSNTTQNINFIQLQDITADKFGNGLRGGTLNITVTLDNKTAVQGNYKIKGENPGKVLIESVLVDPVMRGIACTESSYRQFEAPREGGKGMPLVGGKPPKECGIGLMQLCDPAPSNNAVWNWKTNISEAKDLFDEKRGYAKKMHNQERNDLNAERKAKGLLPCPIWAPTPLNKEQEDRETLRRYNCGKEYRWEPRDSFACEGKLVVKPDFSRCKGSQDLDYPDKILNCKI